MTESKPLAVDPVTVEIIRNGLLAVTEEMKSNLMRTAYNLIIYEALDFTVGLFTAEGETVSIGLGLPMFIRGMAETVKAKIAKFAGDLNPGDIIVTNDAYITGSHLNHFTFTMPVFHQGELIAFTCCMAHWQDVGGAPGGSTSDIYSEGLQVPIVKYRRAGVVNQDLLDIIGINVRIPERAMGDLRAQIIAITSGEKRFLELVERYGRAAIDGAIVILADQADAAARAATLSIPDGVYEAESFMDDDGLEIGRRVPIRVRIEKRGDEMTIDLSDVSKQVAGSYNSGVTTGIGLAQVAFKCLTTPTHYPVSDGAFRALKVIMPMGRVVSAVRPAPMRWWMSYPMTVIDTIFKALAPAIPDRVIAGHHADLVIASLHGINPADGRFFMTSIGPIGGGWGAKSSEDGVGVTVCINDGDTHNGPSEQLEVKYPVLIERYALRPDSGGAGLHRGGLGAEIVVQALSPISFNTYVERVHCPPWGLEGGGDAAGNAVNIRRGGAWRDDLPNGKLLSQRLAAGDAFMIQSGGGGGFGDPRRRDPELVAYDVREGYVTREAAQAQYGVVIDAATGDVDPTATRAQRASGPT